MATILDGAGSVDFNFSSGVDPWAYFYAVSNDTSSARYYAWLNAVRQANGSSPPSTFELLATSSPPSAGELKLIFIVKMLRLVYTPLIIGLGLLGNTLTWLVLLRSRLRTLSSSHYLAATVLVNTLYLLALLIQWLSFFGLDTYNQPGWCQFVNFINKTSSFLSVWYLTAFAVDRYVCICWPTEAARMCTRMRARIVIVSLLCVGIVVFMNISLTVGVFVHKGRLRCNPLPIFQLDLQVLEMIDMVVNLGVPYLAILTLTALIVCNTYKAKRQRELSNDPAQLRGVTVVFLTVCLACHLPNELFRVVYTIHSLLNKGSPTTTAVYFTHAVTRHLFHTSLATHFIVFAACYPMFSQSCKTPFRWLRHKLLVKFRKAPHGGAGGSNDINLRNVRFHAVQDDTNVTHV